VARTTLCGATREGFRRWVRESDERLALVMRAALHDPILRVDQGAAEAPSRAPRIAGGDTRA
jgi:hypothetical protein